MLEKLAAAQAGGSDTVKGYHVKTSYKTLTDAEKQQRHEWLGGAVAGAIQRTKKGAKK
mgnify:CR=1 FL=1